MSSRLEKYKIRLIDKIISDNLEILGVICVEEPKLCDKTWTSLKHAKTLFLLVTQKITLKIEL